MKWRSLFSVLLLGTTILLAACGKQNPSFSSIDITGINYGRDFHLTDPSSQERSLEDFRGKVVMLFFGYTQCPNVCPTALARAAEVRQRLGADDERLQVIFVTLDPERDTPAVLKEYTAAFDPTFLGLYTAPERTKQVADDFHIEYRKVPAGASYSIDHTALTYVFDPKGRLRLAVPHQQSAENVANDIRTLLHSASIS